MCRSITIENTARIQALGLASVHSAALSRSSARHPRRTPLGDNLAPVRPVAPQELEEAAVEAGR